MNDIPVEAAFCSRCGAPAAFEMDDVEGIVSVCCSSRPASVESPSWMEPE
jgi:hypothetical protein